MFLCMKSPHGINQKWWLNIFVALCGLSYFKVLVQTTDKEQYQTKHLFPNSFTVQANYFYVYKIPTWWAIEIMHLYFCAIVWMINCIKIKIIAAHFCFHHIGHQNGVLVLSCNGTVRLKKCKQLFEYQHLLLLRDICGLYYKTFTIVIYDRNAHWPVL